MYLQGEIKLAQVRHCYIITMWKQSFYFTNTYTQFGLNKTRGGSSPPMNEEWLNETQAGKQAAGLAALVVGLYCAPVVGLCGGTQHVSFSIHFTPTATVDLN